MSAGWPVLPYDSWSPTRRALHMYAQMLGKLALALAPPQPEWLHTRLLLVPRGLATGSLPWRGQLLQAAVDIFTEEMILDLSDGRRRSIQLGRDRCVADVWQELTRILRDLGVDVSLWDKPQEIADPIDFSMNRSDCGLNFDHAHAMFTALAATNDVFETFRSRFFGRSGVQFWWGGFDLAVLLFTGRRLPPPETAGYILRYDLDVEHLNAGLWLGNDSSPEPVFYGYLVPKPPGCETAVIAPPQAGWVQNLEEWVLPYEAVRSSTEPNSALLDFLNRVYELALELGGWNSEAYRYEQPRPAAGRRPAA